MARKAAQSGCPTKHLIPASGLTILATPSAAGPRRRLILAREVVMAPPRRIREGVIGGVDGYRVTWAARYQARSGQVERV